MNVIIVIPNGYTKEKSECICSYSIGQVPAWLHEFYLKENGVLLLVGSIWPTGIMCVCAHASEWVCVYTYKDKI
jgi:hypothetical protein